MIFTTKSDLVSEIEKFLQINSNLKKETNYNLHFLQIINNTILMYNLRTAFRFSLEASPFGVEEGYISIPKFLEELKVAKKIKKTSFTIEANAESSKILDFYSLFEEMKAECKFPLEVELNEEIFRYASDDEIKYFMQGVYVDTQNKCIVATDGHVACKIESPKMIGIKSVTLNPKWEKYLSIKGLVGDRYTYSKKNDLEIIMVNADGKFPNYARIYDGLEKNRNVLTLDKSHFEEACIRNPKAIKYLPIKEVAFNPKFIKNFFKYNEKVELMYGENLRSAFVFTKKDTAILIMPCKID